MGAFCKHVCDRTQTRYMFCAAFFWSLFEVSLVMGFRGVGGGGGWGHFANMSVIEHKRVTCFVLFFFWSVFLIRGLSCHGVSGGWGGVGVFCKHVFRGVEAS